MLRYFIAFIVCIVTTISGAAWAQGKRVALIVGNSAYHVSPLANPTNDADAVAAAMTGLGFTVTLRKDLGIEAMRRELAAFGRQATGAEMAVVFYAGHGTEMAGRNFLIPVDARLQRAADIELEAIGLETVIAQLDGATVLKLVILDACRNNIFPMAGAKRSLSRGLAGVEPGGNSLVAYAAKEGTLADDGTGARNSPFTTALLKNIALPGLDIRLMFGGVRDDVLLATGGKQEPYLYGTAGRQAIYLKAAAAAATPIDPEAARKVFEAEVARRVDAERKRMAAELDAERRKVADATAPATQPKLAPIAPDVAPKVAPSPTETPMRKSDAPDPAIAIKPGSGQTFRDCYDADDPMKNRTCPEMVVVPAGSFMMGSPNNEAGRGTDEGPQHRVTIARPYAVGKFEVTFDEWEACAANAGCLSNPNPDDPGWGKGRRPVINVSWNDAKAYVTWLSRKTERGYRLLSEAEWEYAARAGTVTRYFWGNEVGSDNANCDGCGSQWIKRTAPVGSFKPNAWGLHDVHGNVLEWVEDCWFDNYSGAPTDGSARIARACGRRVGRGSSWYANPPHARSATRHGDAWQGKSSTLGFRIARSIGP